MARRDPKVGTGKKPKGSGRRLYTDENPRDTVSIKFATPSDARATVAKVKADLELAVVFAFNFSSFPARIAVGLFSLGRLDDRIVILGRLT